MSAEITYKGKKLADLSVGESVSLRCKGKIMQGNIVVSGECSVAYGDAPLASTNIYTGPIAILCKGKLMEHNLRVSIEKKALSAPVISINKNILTIVNYDDYPLGTEVTVNFSAWGSVMQSLTLTEKTHDLNQYIWTWFSTMYEVFAYATVDGKEMIGDSITWNCAPVPVDAPTLSFNEGSGNYNITDNSGEAVSYRLYLYDGDGGILRTEIGGCFVSSSGILKDVLVGNIPGWTDYPTSMFALQASVVTANGVESEYSVPIFFTYNEIDGTITKV